MSDLQDLLGSALSSSFSLPIPPPREKPTPAISQVLHPEKDETSAEEMEDWKPEYDARLSKWQAEAAEAREKAEATRVRIEKERETEQLSVKQRAENEKKVLSEVEEKRRREERLKRELGEEDVIRSSSSRGDKVREAWELVKGHEVVTDGRGVTGGDTTRQKEPLKAPMYDPTTSTDPLPPYLQDDLPRSSNNHNNKSISQSVTSGTWESISRSTSSIEDLSPPIGSSTSTSSGKDKDIMTSNKSSNVIGRNLTEPTPKEISPGGLSLADLPSTASKPINPNGNRPSNNNQPPSLTLSLFTLPSHLSFTRVLAVVGINFVLPFINGVMLGFGEIFARETVRVGKLFWRGERAVWGYRRGDTGGARGVASVGLSGSGGFP